MEHTNLFLYETEEDFLAEYPEGKMDQPVPGVAYIRGEVGELGTLHVNREIVTYEITIHSTDRSGVTVALDYTIETPEVLDGNEVKVNIVAEEIEGYKPRYATEKATFSGDASYTVIYLAPTAYTVTVNHVYSGQSIASATTIEVDDVYEEDVVRVKVEPLSIPGYTADPVYISVSGDMTYNLEYEVSGPVYEFVDLGLPSGTLWATTNIGASSPEEFGDYYAWGEKATKTAYTYDNYSFYDVEEDEFTKYNYEDGKYMLDLEDDVAYAKVGDSEAHIPTNLQFEELLDYCDTAWTVINGVSGLQVTASDSPQSDDRSLPSIFFPAAGMYDEKDGLMGDGFAVFVASNTLDSPSNNYLLVAFYESVRITDCPRHYGLTVRAVKGEGPQPPQEPETA